LFNICCKGVGLCLTKRMEWNMLTFFVFAEMLEVLHKSYLWKKSCLHNQWSKLFKKKGTYVKYCNILPVSTICVAHCLL
jgi:hypothetical protein